MRPFKQTGKSDNVDTHNLYMYTNYKCVILLSYYFINLSVYMYTQYMLIITYACTCIHSQTWSVQIYYVLSICYISVAVHQISRKNGHFITSTNHIFQSPPKLPLTSFLSDHQIIYNIINAIPDKTHFLWLIYETISIRQSINWFMKNYL